ncbi:MAG: DUF2029 domain-containing protein, partial [Chloroflexi bacterium]|nr:DUF2029 domain-containing protein [Chloroflexota bacterium]
MDVVTSRRLIHWALWALVALLALRFLWFATTVARQHTSGFAAYYTAARLVRAGADAGQFYDEAWFREQVAQDTPTIGDIYNVGPPATALLLLPLAGLSYEPARVVWTAFNVVILALAAVWLVRQTALPGHVAAAALVVLLLYQPLYANFALGQAYVLLLGLLVVAWHSYRQRRDGLLGAALGLMLVLKTAGILLWPLLVVQRRWQALLWAAGTALLVIVGSLPWLGLPAWLTYLRLLPGFTGRPELAVTAYQTHLSFFRHLFGFNPQWNPAPLWPAPWLATALPWLALLSLVGISSYEALRAGDSDELFAAFAVLSVILSPVALDYHYTLLLLPLAIGLAWWWRVRPGLRPTLLLAAAVLLV